MAVQGTSCQGRDCTCCSSDGSRPSHVLPLLEDTAWHLPRALRPPGMQGRGARVIAWLGHLAQSSEHASCPDGPSRTWLTATCVLHQSTTKSDGRWGRQARELLADLFHGLLFGGQPMRFD